MFKIKMMSVVRVVLGVLGFFIVGLVSAQKLSRTEKKISKSIESNNAEAIGFLEEVVNINSGTLNLPGEKR